MVSPPESLHQVTPTHLADFARPWKKLRLWHYTWGFLPIAIAAAVGGVYGYRSLTSPETNTVVATPLSVDVMTVEPVSEYTTRRDYTGEVVAGRSSTLGFERPGTVISVLVEEGDRVTTGQPLARLDTRTLEAQRQQLEAQRQTALAQLRELEAGPRREDIATAEATVAEIEQQLALAQLQRDRRQDLYLQGAISREELDREVFNTGALENRLAQAQSQLAELRAGTRIEQLDAQSARVNQLDASLNQIDVDLDKSVLFAPFDGTISRRTVDEGVVVGSGQAVLQLVEAGSLEVRVGVPPAVADTLAVGGEQPITIGDRPYTATVVALLPELDASTRTVTVVLELDAADVNVGETARLTVTDTQPAEGFWLPTTALVPGERGLWSVYVLAELDGDDRPLNTYTIRRREVEVVHTEGDHVLVRGTLQAGEQAIATGTHRIAPGQTVTLPQAQ